MRIDASHLPGLRSLPHTTWTYSRGEAVAPLDIRIATLTPALLEMQVDALLKARLTHLAERNVLDIVGVIDAVAHRFLDESDALRATALEAIAVVSGFSREMSARVLTGMAEDWREEPLRGLLEADFGDPRVLDDFVSVQGSASRRRAYGPDLTFHLFSGNVPGVSVTSLIRGLLLKSASLAKTASGEPALAALFAQAIATEDPGLGDCLAVTYWAGGDEPLEEVALRRASAVVVYGGAETIDSLRSRTPRATQFIGYGHRVSFGIVAREALSLDSATAVAREAAESVAMFDQQGCVSPHLFYVEEGGATSPTEWAAHLADAMRVLEAALPRGAVAPGEAAAIRQARAEAEFGQFAGSGHRLYVSESGTSWSVIFDPDPTFTPSCLNRVIRVKPVADIDEIASLVAPLQSLLQTVGVAGNVARLDSVAGDLGRLGASRITPIASAAWPPPEWHHDGRPPLGDLVRWCDVE